MEEMVTQFFSQYSWQLTLIAASGILLLGILKFFNVFKKVDESKRKYVYAGISSGFSIIAGVIYLVCIKSFNGATFGITAVAIYTLNQTLYSVYETYGLRTLVQKFGNVFITLVAGKQLNSAKKALTTQTVADDDLIEPLSAEANDELDGSNNVSAEKLENDN